MLEEIFSSRIGTKLVLKMGREPYREFYLYQLSKELKIGLGRTKTILEMLKKQGILTSARSGRRIVYRLNENNRLVHDIINLAHKDALMKADERYRSNINALNDLYRNALGSNLISAVLFGSVAKGKARKWSDIDILLIVKKKVGKVTRERIHKKTSLATDIYSNISEEHYYTEKEFESSYIIGDDFLINVMQDGIIMHDSGFFSRYLIRGIPTVTSKHISRMLDTAKEWIGSCLDQYKDFPQTAPDSLWTISMRLARAMLLLNGINPGSRHDIPEQLLKINEEKLSSIYKTTRKWFDSPPLEVEKERVWKILMFLKEEYNKSVKMLEEWA